jgi:NTE family protein
VALGLVLGAGGVAGAAYLAGALAAIEHDYGLDPRAADVIVGTSAGAFVGALLRRGVPAADLAAWTVDAPLSPPGAAVTRDVVRPAFDPIGLRTFLRPPRAPHLAAIVAGLRRPHRLDPWRVLMTHVADGERDLAAHTEFLGPRWPSSPLYLNAVRRRDGRRVVFGRDAMPRDGLGRAVAASCAVPGYFAPVPVDGERFLDGGVKSSTNADVLAVNGRQPAATSAPSKAAGKGAARRPRLELVLVVAPMASHGATPRLGLDAALRQRVRRQIAAELAPLRAEGTRTLVLAPGPETRALIGLDFMEDRREIVAAALLETGARLRDRDAVAALTG